MKKLIILTLLFSTNLMAQTINITKVSTAPDYYYKFKLESNKAKAAHIKLDCQSFLQKIDFFDKEGKLYSENYITIDECDYLYKQTKSCIKQNKYKCFDPNYIFSDGCDC